MLKSAKNEEKTLLMLPMCRGVERGWDAAHVWVWKTQVRVWTFVPGRIVEWIPVANRKDWA